MGDPKEPSQSSATATTTKSDSSTGSSGPAPRSAIDYKDSGQIKAKSLTVITLVEEVYRKRTGDKIRVNDAHKAYLDLLSAPDEEKFLDIVIREFKNIPHADLRTKGSKTAGVIKIPEGYLPMEFPSVFNIAVTNYHPEGYPQFKKGFLDAAVDLSVMGEVYFEGERWRYLVDKITDEANNDVFLKKNMGKGRSLEDISPEVKDLLISKIKEVDDAMASYKLSGNPDSKEAKELLRKIKQLVKVDLFNQDLQKVGEKIQPLLKGGKVDMFLEMMKDDKPELRTVYEWQSKDGKVTRWQLNQELEVEKVDNQIKSVKVKRILNFFAIEPEHALGKASKMLTDNDLPNFAGLYKSFPPRARNELLFRKGNWLFNTGGETAPAMANPNFLRTFIKSGFRSATFDAFLGGILAYSEGKDSMEAVAYGVAKLVHGMTIDLGKGYLLSRMITKFLLRDTLDAGVRRLGLRIVSVVSWALFVVSTAETVSTIVENFAYKDFRGYYVRTKQEFDAVHAASKAGARYPYAEYPHPESWYIEVEKQEEQGVTSILSIGKYRWKYVDMTGRGQRRAKSQYYDTVPRSVRLYIKSIFSKEYSYLEYGEEVLTVKTSGLPFTNYLPDFDQAIFVGTSDELRTKRDLHKAWEHNFTVIEKHLNDLYHLVYKNQLKKAEEDWYDIISKIDRIFDQFFFTDEEKMKIKGTMRFIEDKKIEIAKQEKDLVTKWCSIVTADSEAIYWWQDFLGKSYCMRIDLKKGGESSPQESRDAMEIIDRIRRQIDGGGISVGKAF